MHQINSINKNKNKNIKQTIFMNLKNVCMMNTMSTWC